jgi:hypothetical protein
MRGEFQTAGAFSASFFVLVRGDRLGGATHTEDGKGRGTWTL